MFWVNVPLAVAGLVASRWLLPPGRRTGGSLDAPAALGITAALALLVLGLSSVIDHGPQAAVARASALGAAVLTVGVMRRESRATDPLLPPGVLRGAVAGASLSALALTASTTSAIMLSVLYLQAVLQMSALRASLLFPLFNIAVTVTSLLGARVLSRFGARRSTAAGFAAIASGAGLLALVPVTGAAVPVILLSFVAMGAGLGVASVTSTHVGTTAADPAHRGVVSGLLTAAAQVCNTLGLSALLPLTGRAGFTPGFTAAAVVAMLGAASASLWTRPHRVPKSSGGTGPPRRTQQAVAEGDGPSWRGAGVDPTDPRRMPAGGPGRCPLLVCHRTRPVRACDDARMGTDRHDFIQQARHQRAHHCRQGDPHQARRGTRTGRRPAGRRRRSP